MFGFKWVEEEGREVGKSLPVHHLTLHDMAEWAILWRMTALILLEEAEVNAIQVLGFERVDEMMGTTTFQPRFIESE